MNIAQSFEKLTEKDGIYTVYTNSVPVQVMFLTDDIIRVRAGFDGGAFKEESYCLMLTGWEDRMDKLFAAHEGEGGRRRVAVQRADMVQTPEKIVLQGKTLRVTIQKKPFQIAIFDQDNRALHADVAGIAYQEDSNYRRLHYSEIENDDCFYGFGEKTGHINKARTSLRMSAKDAMGYDSEKTDALYKHIPFYIKLSGKTKKAVGYFYHNTFECEFNMGREKSNYWHYYSKYCADGGDIDLFFINGPSIADVVRRYTDITGKSALLPRYAFGYLGSSMYYSELESGCGDAIKGFIETNHKEGIPIDGFQLSSGYTTQANNKRCTFTWNTKRFKNPEQFFADMEASGVTVTPNVKPGFLLEHPLFEAMKNKGMFIKNSAGDGIGTGSWWGGEGAFVDFTDEKVREYWAQYLAEAVLKKGTASVWNDNCEYDSLVDKDCLCSFEGARGSVGQLKAVMANLMCYTTEKAVRQTFANIRPFIVCRAGYSGIQRYAQTWAGDNETSFQSLKYNIATILGMGLSGVANHGCDIGGFYGPAPEPELLVRWTQNGIFQPRFSIHSVNTDNTVTEPWMYPAYTPYIREAIKLRYTLIPYLYSLAAGAHETGEPIMRPLFYDFQHDEHCYNEGINFMFGPSLLVANVVEKGAATKRVYLPRGSRFYDYLSRVPYEGGKDIEVPVDIASIPLFVRSGAIIPYHIEAENNLHKQKAAKLGVLMEGSVNAFFTLYEDDGISNDYQKGIYRKTHIQITAGERAVISFNAEGPYQTLYQSLFIDFISTEKGPYFVKVNGDALPCYLYRPRFEAAEEGWYYNHSLKSVQIKIKKMSCPLTVIISFEQFDMIGMTEEV